MYTMRFWNRCSLGKHLLGSPTVEVVPAGALTASQGVANDPQDEQDCGHNPQEMYRETNPGKKQNE
jgi:hypothetical protein